MNYEFRNSRLTFTFKSNYLKEPVVFTLKRNRPPSATGLRRLENEISYLEQWAWDQDMSAKELCDTYTDMAIENFRRILKGAIHACSIEIISFKVATRLNEKGQNDYRTIRETRNPFRKWVKA